MIQNLHVSRHWQHSKWSLCTVTVCVQEVWIWFDWKTNSENTGSFGSFFFLNNKSLISGYHHHPFWPTDPEIPDNGPNTISCKWMKIYHLLWVGAEIWLCALGLTSLSVPPFPYYATGIKNSYSHRIIGLQIRIHKSLHQYLTANKRYLSQ